MKVQTMMSDIQRQMTMSMTLTTSQSHNVTLWFVICDWKSLNVICWVFFNNWSSGLLEWVKLSMYVTDSCDSCLWPQRKCRHDTAREVKVGDTQMIWFNEQFEHPISPDQGRDSGGKFGNKKTPRLREQDKTFFDILKTDSEWQTTSWSSSDWTGTGTESLAANGTGTEFPEVHRNWKWNLATIFHTTSLRISVETETESALGI